MKKIALFFIVVAMSMMFAGEAIAQRGRVRVGIGTGPGLGSGSYRYGYPYGSAYGYPYGYRLPPGYKFWSGSHYEPSAKYRYGPYYQYDYRYESGPNSSKYSYRSPYGGSYHRPYYESETPGLWGGMAGGPLMSPWWNWNAASDGGYYNPYAAYVQDPVYDYTEPIYTKSALAARDKKSKKDSIASSTESAASTGIAGSATEGGETTSSKQQATRYFKQAYAAFRDGNYTDAMQAINQAIDETPQNLVFHEFRALILFAIGKYSQAAAILHSVLASGPSWRWATMIRFYPDSGQYTEQLRELEDFVRRNKRDAAARFLLAYHYLIMGYPKNAASQLQQVVELQPKDVLARRILSRIESKN